MGYIKFLIVLCTTLLSPTFLTGLGIQQKYLPDLRRFRVGGVAGRFAVNRSALEKELQDRRKQDAVCGKEVKLQLPQSLEHSTYDISRDQGEVIFLHETITDFTLAAELPANLREKIATSYHFLSVAIPVIIGNERHSGLMFLTNFLTNSTKKVLFPYLTNVGQPKQVDSIVEEDNGTVTIRLGDDVIIYQVKDEIRCKSANSVGKDFDEITGKVITDTAYPLSFDWGCEYLGAQISFCQALNQFECELKAVGGDVCTLTSTSKSERYPTTMAIVNMTGIFRELFPLLAETVPSESFEAEIIDRIHTTGIKFPCLE